MGFNSISFVSEPATYFGLQTGFNSLSFAAESATYFGLQTGFNSVGFGANISIGRLFLTGSLFTGATVITVTSSQGSYQVNTSTGYFPVYPYWSDPTTVIQLDIEADAGQYVGEVSITPTTPGYIDIDLEEVLGMAVKGTASVVVPKVAENAIEPDADSLPFDTISCCETEAVFTDQIGTESLKNDQSSFLFRKYAKLDTVELELWKGSVKVADIIDDSLGVYYPFGSLGNPATPQSNYKGVVLDWFKVFDTYGFGRYTLRVNQTILGNASTICSRIFILQPYSIANANGTVRIESYQDGNIISSAFDYTGLVDGGWYASYRIKGIFGFKSPINELDKYITSDYVSQQIQQTIRNEYTLESKLITPAIADALVYDSFTANKVIITDYNVNNNGAYAPIEVFPVSYEPTYFPNNNKPKYIIKLEEAVQNRIKRNF